MLGKWMIFGGVMLVAGCDMASPKVGDVTAPMPGFASTDSGSTNFQLPDIDYWVKAGGGHFEDFGARDPSAPNMLLNHWTLANASTSEPLQPETAKAVSDDTALAIDLHDVVLTPELQSQLSNLQRLQWLSLSSGVDGTDFGWLGSMKSLRGLALTHARLGKANFSGMEKARGLQYLSLASATFERAAFATFPRLEKLETLFLSGKQINDDSLKRLAELHLPMLRSLCLEDTSITDAGMRSLCEAYDLEFLNLYRSRNISAMSVGAIARMQRLHLLGVGFSGIAPECRPTEAVMELQRLLPKCRVDYGD